MLSGPHFVILIGFHGTVLDSVLDDEIIDCKANPAEAEKTDSQKNLNKIINL